MPPISGKGTTFSEFEMQITLPDNSVREFDGPITGFELAGSIGPGLLKAAVAVEVDGVEQDLSEPIEKDCHAFEIDSETKNGRVALLYRGSH